MRTTKEMFYGMVQGCLHKIRTGGAVLGPRANRGIFLQA